MSGERGMLYRRYQNHGIVALRKAASERLPERRQSGLRPPCWSRPQSGQAKCDPRLTNSSARRRGVLWLPSYVQGANTLNPAICGRSYTTFELYTRPADLMKTAPEVHGLTAAGNGEGALLLSVRHRAAASSRSAHGFDDKTVSTDVPVDDARRVVRARGCAASALANALRQSAERREK